VSIDCSAWPCDGAAFAALALRGAGRSPSAASAKIVREIRPSKDFQLHFAADRNRVANLEPQQLEVARIPKKS
jgi:hypothetical protein